MSIQRDSKQNRLWHMILWTLRVTVVVQCVGNWRWLTQIEETPLLHWMLDPADIGGLAWSETTSLAVQQVVGWLTLLAGGLILWWPHVVVLAPLVLLQTLIAVAMWQIDGGYFLEVSWVSPRLLALFPFATQLARIAAPLGLLLLEFGPKQPRWDRPRVAQTMQMLRWAVAIVFLAHGLEAWQRNPQFLDLLINSSRRLLGLSLSQATAERGLALIGAIDILIAVGCVCSRSLPVWWWMALWGGITTFSRLAANGWEISWHETLTRISHFGIPLAVVLWWLLLKCTATKTSPAKNLNDATQGTIK